MDLSSIQITIKKSERTINRLHGLIHPTFAELDKDKAHYEQWQNACADFHRQYQAMVFNYQEHQGEKGLYDLLSHHHPYTIEFALCFIEIRPYYYRSGYMYQKLRPKPKHAPLTVEQQHRYEEIREAYRDYRVSKRSCS